MYRLTKCESDQIFWTTMKETQDFIVVLKAKTVLNTSDYWITMIAKYI